MTHWTGPDRESPPKSYRRRNRPLRRALPSVLGERVRRVLQLHFYNTSFSRRARSPPFERQNAVCVFLSAHAPLAASARRRRRRPERTNELRSLTLRQRSTLVNRRAVRQLLATRIRFVVTREHLLGTRNYWPETSKQRATSKNAVPDESGAHFFFCNSL